MSHRRHLRVIRSRYKDSDGFAHLLEVLPSARARSGEVGRKCCIFSTLMFGFPTKAHCSSLSQLIYFKSVLPQINVSSNLYSFT